ncbi:MAG: hypothetical protein MR296_00190, partial [Tenericutes bacterium]|nr:hypothetical protein [Mycoplasmatota bacterium]
MIKVIIIVFAFLALMILIMFFLLKNIVKTINEQSKSYFALKLQDYDDLVEEKSKKLDEIKSNYNETKIEENNKIKEESDNGIVNKASVIDFSNANYQVEDILERFKEIDKRFVINSKSVVEKFLKDINTYDNNYNVLISIKNKINSLGIYELLSSNKSDAYKKILSVLNEEETNILKKYSKSSSFRVDEFLSYLDYEIKKSDPTIYVEVGNKDENYDYLSPNIKTVYNKRIYKGIMITY